MKKDDLELDFNGMRTENYSSTIPYMKNLTVDAKTLLERLPKNNVKIGLFQDSENYDMYKMFEENTETAHENNFSETSPFISSDVYNDLIQKGGALSATSITENTISSNESLQGGGRDEDSSESTTSESDSESDHKKHSKNKKHSKHSKHSEESTETVEDDTADQMLSSMSHESRTHSQSSNNSFISSSNNKYQSDSELLSTISLNHKGRYNYTESINTSDINIVSVDD